MPQLPPAVGPLLELLTALRACTPPTTPHPSPPRPILVYSACGGAGKQRAALLGVLWWAVEQSEREGVVDPATDILG